MAEITGGALIARMLRAEGVEAVFGIVDGSVAIASNGPGAANALPAWPWRTARGIGCC